jgi:hypothetical protein
MVRYSIEYLKLLTWPVHVAEAVAASGERMIRVPSVPVDFLPQAHLRNTTARDCISTPPYNGEPQR